MRGAREEVPKTCDGWLITTEQHAAERTTSTFIAVLAPETPHEMVYHITNILASGHDVQPDAVSYLWLNDGTPWYEEIVSMNATNLRARKIYRSTVRMQSGQQTVLTWDEPSIVVDDTTPTVAYWEACSIHLPLHA